MAQTLAIYTVAMGAEYKLPKTVPCPGVSYICFSDRPQADSNGWTVRQVEPLFPLELARSSREQKIRPHRWLQNFDRTIYVDTKVQLTGSPLELWDFLIPNERVVFGALHHSFRATVADEFALVKGKGFETRAVLEEQLEVYRKIAPEVLEQRPVWGGMIARRHNNPAVIDSMELWFAHVLRYARRDQLSLVLALSQMPQSHVSLIACNNHESDYHLWPVGPVEQPARFFQELRPLDEDLLQKGMGLARNLRQKFRSRVK